LCDRARALTSEKQKARGDVRAGGISFHDVIMTVICPTDQIKQNVIIAVRQIATDIFPHAMETIKPAAGFAARAV
jgi:hypothetical protein